MAVCRERRTGNWTVKVRDASGKQRTLTANRKNLLAFGIRPKGNIGKREARQLEKALETKLSTDGDCLPQKVKLSNLISRYLSSGNGSHSHASRTKLVLERYFLEPVGDRLVGSITMQHVEAFKSGLIEGRSSTTVRDYLLDLRTFFKWVRKNGYIADDPTEGIPLPPSKRDPVEFLTPEQASMLIQAVRGLSIESAIVGALNLGLRRAEITRLKWRDVNFEVGMVLVRGTKTRNALREIPLPTDFGEYLKNIPQDGEHVFMNTDGEPLTNSMLNSGVGRTRRKKLVGFHWYFQMLRRTYGSTLVLRGVPIEYVSKYLGHDDIRVTQKWYLGLRSSDYADKVSQALHGLI